ncbi:hypothetical protein [Pseudomonas typographi]|nr:hypothetical protein [Pseudomonas typographi]
MKKAIIVCWVSLLSVAAVSAQACPKGTHPVGGTGSHHKGGFCQ